MTVKELRVSFVNELSKIYEPEEVLSLFYMLTEAIIGYTRIEVAVNLSKKLTNDEVERFAETLKRLKTQEPIQYIIGEVHFYESSFFVDKNVLIPRPETEELVDWIVKDQKGRQNSLKILDIGTGSGCIAISLAKSLPNAKVYALDVSEKALEMAKKNAMKNQVAVKFVKEDILETKSLFQNFDIIVSNPPYVRELEKQEMKPNVLDNEPSGALFVSDNDPLLFYNKITVLAQKSLLDNGRLYFEINQYLGEETKSMIEDKGFVAVDLRKDMYGNDRMIRASLTK